MLSWDGELDPLLDLTLDVRRELNDRLTGLLGVNGAFAPGVERERRGNRPIVHSKSVFFPNLIFGLALRLR
jgi:hypothetical protein